MITRNVPNLLPFFLNGECGTGDRMIMQHTLGLEQEGMAPCIVSCTTPFMDGTKLLAFLPTPFHSR